MFTVKDHDYFIEPVPDYLHNIHIVDSDFNKPHIIYRRSVEETKRLFETPSESFSRLWSRDIRPCGTASKVKFVLFFPFPFSPIKIYAISKDVLIIKY